MYTVIVLLSLLSWAQCIDPEVQEKYEKLPRDEFVKYFNKKGFSWKIKNNDFIDNKFMNTVEIDRLVIPAKLNNSGSDVPSEFDVREHWTNCFFMNGRYTQDSNCSSGWAVIAASVASDRICTVTSKMHHSLNLFLSNYDLLCCKECFDKDYCSGGSPEQALFFYMRNGLVTFNCKDSMPDNQECKHVCEDDDVYYMPDKHFGQFMYMMFEDERDIRREIAEHGSLLAIFKVYEDFRDYKSGIYVHTHGKLVGYHSVKVIGYGEEDGVPYWLAVNSWGYKWGNAGEFKIKRLQEDIDFEKRMISVLPRLIH